jgi:glycolate oxidase FAD binding subunit
MSQLPTTPAEVQEIVQVESRLLPRGRGSKPALSTPPEEVPGLDLSRLSGLIEYEPGEFTFTALAGTPIGEVAAALAREGQFLPFDPLLVRQNATLGGVVATGTSGPGRYRFGGVRDFLIGVRFVDGAGRLVRGGGKVVKNSAGFDLPKLMVGSLGRLAVLTELTFKVFPRPETYATLQVEYPGLQPALQAIQSLTTSQLDLDALDLEPPGTLRARIGGLGEVMPERLQRLQAFLRERDDRIKGVEVLQGQADEAVWQELQAFGWVPAGWSVVKAPLTVNRIPGLEKGLEAHDTCQRYSAGGNLAWVAWPPEAGGDHPPLAGLDSILTDLGLAGLVLLGPPTRIRLGVWPGAALLQRVKQALDPGGKFLEL